MTAATFGEAFASFLDEYFERYPVTATATGDHRFDATWPDATEAGRLDRLAFIDRWREAFAALGGLTADDAIDRDLLLGELDAARFAEGELREDAWNPLDWVYLLGEGLFGLLSREFAPLAERLASVAGRLEGMPAVVDGAKAALVGVDGRPVARFQTETAISNLPGVGELIDEAIGLADAARRRSSRRRRPGSPGRGGRDRSPGAGRIRGPPARCRAAGERRRRARRCRRCSPRRCATRCAPSA